MKHLSVINIFSALMILVCATTMQAQNFRLHDQVISAGLGFGSYYYSQSEYSMSMPALSIAYEKGISDGVLDKGVFGIGGVVSTMAYNNNYFSPSSRSSLIILGGRGLLHYPIIEDKKIDTYAGLMLGLQIESWSGNTQFYKGGTSLAYSFILGGRYYFADNLAGMLEIGYGLTFLNLGLAYKL